MTDTFHTGMQSIQVLSSCVLTWSLSYPIHVLFMGFTVSAVGQQFGCVAVVATGGMELIFVLEAHVMLCFVCSAGFVKPPVTPPQCFAVAEQHLQGPGFLSKHPGMGRLRWTGTCIRQLAQANQRVMNSNKI